MFLSPIHNRMTLENWLPASLRRKSVLFNSLSTWIHLAYHSLMSMTALYLASLLSFAVFLLPPSLTLYLLYTNVLPHAPSLMHKPQTFRKRAGCITESEVWPWLFKSPLCLLHAFMFLIFFSIIINTRDGTQVFRIHSTICKTAISLLYTLLYGR